MKPILILLLGCMLLTGCMSRLKVTVEAANRDAVLAKHKELQQEKNSSGDRKILNAIVALQNFTAKHSENSNAALITALTTLKKDMRAAEVSPEVQKDIKDYIDTTINTIANLQDQANIAYLNHNNPEAKKLIKQAYLVVTEFEQFLKESKKAVADEKIPVINESLQQISQAKEPLNGTERTRFPLLGDEMTSFITQGKSKDHDLWKGVFNKTVSFNLLGNSDVAVILRSNPTERELKSGDYNNNFTIKGVRMDAADATNATFNGLTQTMHFIASTYGLPLGQSGSEATTTTTTATSTEDTIIQNIHSDRAKLAQKQQLIADSKALLLAKIQLENVTGRKDSDDKKAALGRVTEFWTTLKAKLNE
ncbi:hypothetical protein [Flavobacterium inviolabile]|uniref:hypothetical protein n=1 Tax=Flavobacterium inviolabile TaxID=2748320 RepID=UPI0015AD1849|nr:hypothetical protein [Flavobacterium inviolabile]